MPPEEQEVSQDELAESLTTPAVAEPQPIMADAKRVVSPEEAADVPPAPAASEPQAPKVLASFWKKINPFEKILFKDKTSLVFGVQRFVTADEALIAKIKEVSAQYGIILQ